MDENDIEQLIETAQKIMKSLHKTKHQAGMGKAEMIEQKKTKGKKLKIWRSQW